MESNNSVCSRFFSDVGIGTHKELSGGRPWDAWVAESYMLWIAHEDGRDRV